MRPSRGNPGKKPPSDPVNEKIRAREVMLIDQDDQNHGVVAVKEALRIAKDSNLDLVQMAKGKNGVPICRIMDHGKWKFQQSKKDKENRRKSQQTQLKEIKLRPNTDDHDMEYRAKNAIKFLSAGSKVKVLVRFRGREHHHMISTGQSMLERFVKLLGDADFRIEKHAAVEAHAISVILAPGDGK